MEFLGRREALFGGAAAALAVGLRVGRAHAQQPLPMRVSSDEMILGRDDAPLTIIEYASLTCHHCGEFHLNTLPQVKREWIDSGKARLVYRDFPFDKAALQAATLARCAGRERFFAFLEALYQGQETWSHAKDPQAALARIAKLGGIGDEKFKACMDDRALSDRILAGRLEGEKTYSVTSTPTFIVNGRKITGAVPYAEFARILEAAAPRG